MENNLPTYLIKLGHESDQHQAWVDSLPNLIKNIAEAWHLKLGTPYIEHATCSYVVSCVYEGKEEVVLKIGLPHFEAMNEIEGLRLLHGNPTVRLLKYDKASNVMLLEKCMPGTSLHLLDLPAQDVIICELLKEIWAVKVSEGPILPLSDMVSLWNEETSQDIRRYPDPYLAEQGCQLKTHLIDTTVEHVLLATDLHAGNVLKAERKPWLVIDIKPFIGDPAYDLTQHVMNSLGRLRENPIDSIKKLADQANVSRARLNDWVFARLASESGGIHQALARTLK